MDAPAAEYMTPREAGAYLGVSHMIIWSLLWDGTLVGHRPIVSHAARGLRLRKDELLDMRNRSARRSARRLGPARVLVGDDGIDYMMPQDAARYIHVSLATIWRWLRCGAITGYHPTITAPTRGIRVRRADLDALPREELHMHARSPHACADAVVAHEQPHML